MRLALAAAALASACGSPPDSAAEADAAVVSPVCDVLAQSCPDGEGCFFAGASGRYLCATSLGLPRYHPCQASNQCSAGDGCHLDDQFEFFCTGYCDYAVHAGERDPERCAEHELCANFDGPVGVCLGICDPLDSSCPDGLGCYVTLDAADICLPVVIAGAPGAPCVRNNDCEPGSGCIDADGSPVCAPYCDHDSNPEQADPRCEGGDVCLSLGPGERIGTCGTP